MDWMRANREAFSAKRKAAASIAVAPPCGRTGGKNPEPAK